MTDQNEYYQYIPGYNGYERPENAVEKQVFDKHPLYKNIPYYNNEIKTLQDINKSFPSSENMENMYYEDNNQYNNQNDANLIYNDGFPSYRMVNYTNPRVVDLSRNGPNSTNSITSDQFSNSVSSRTENFKVSELSKLTEAIRELTSRLPVPPSPELLKSVHPNLAVKLQLTYLKAYIQNQQLLMDLKSNLEVPFTTTEFPKFTQNIQTEPSDSNNGSNLQNYPIVQLRTQHPQFPTPLLSPQAISTQPQLNDSNFGNLLECVQNFPITNFNCPQLTNYPNFYYPLTNQPNPSLPQLPNYPQLTNYPHLTSRSDYQYQNGSYKGENYQENFKEQENFDEELKDVENPGLLVPSEYRDRVKYNSSKRSFVSVYLNSLGLRKRKSFSINKFGMNKALKLAISFSNQLTLNSNLDKEASNGTLPTQGTYPENDNFDSFGENFRLAVRERNLIEDVCENALSINSKSTENFELFEKALSMDRVRGLVYSPGANVWMSIFYKKRKRKIQSFSVQEFGFDKCYQMGLTFFNNNPQVVRSKLSGVLSYWLESIPTKTLVIIFKIKSWTASQNSPSNSSSKSPNNLNKSARNTPREDSDRIYLGRFELDVYGSFLAAKRASQIWCNYVKKYPSQQVPFLSSRKNSNSLNGTRELSKLDKSFLTNLDEDLKKIGFVYYDDFNKVWVVLNASQVTTFSAVTLGHLESKKQAIALRHKFILDNKLNNL